MPGAGSNGVRLAGAMAVCLAVLAQPVPIDNASKPTLAISVNRTSEAPVAHRGLPILIEAWLFFPERPDDAQRAAGRIPVSDATEWDSALSLSAFDGSGNRMNWQLQLVGKPDGPPVLTPERPVMLRWWLSPQETRDAAAGSFALLATAGQTISSGQFVFELKPAPDSWDVGHHLLLARYQLDIGEPESALSSIGKALEIDPEDYEALALKSDVEVRLDRLEDALRTLDFALELAAKSAQPEDEPPLVFLNRYNRLLDRILKPAVP